MHCSQLSSPRLLVLCILALFFFPIAVFALAASATLVTLSFAQTAVENIDSVVSPIKSFVRYVGKRDKIAMLTQFLPDGDALIIRHGQISQMRLRVFVDRLPPLMAHLDEVPPPAAHVDEHINISLVKVDGDLAMVWADYYFTIAGKNRHCGTDVFNLLRRDNRWLIAGLAETDRNNCSTE